MTQPRAGVDRLAWRLSSFYFFYYATVGAFMPYWSPYLAARGFSAAQMGIAYALMGGMRTFVPLAWGWYADHRGKRVGLIRAASLAALLSFLTIPFVPGVFWVGAVMVAYTLFWHALLPQFEVVALSHTAARGGDYARVRLWGSVGFIVTVLGLGLLLDRVGMLWLPWLVGLFWLGMALSSWLVPEPPPLRAAAAGAPASLLAALRQPGVLALLVVCFCSQLSFAPYYNFFTLFLDRHGYARSVAGLLWSLAVIAEIVMFVYAGRLIARVGARRLMVLALAATALRWSLTALCVDAWPLLIALQISHALSFASYHAVAMHYVQRLFPGALQGRGQAIYNAAAYGIGGSVGSLSAGYLWQAQSPETVYLAAGLVAAIGWWVAYRRLPAADA
ncbi:MFS transporter [Solimonas variicoloris]|uniref:MFS transporter n=1 Tax=Solimonas variicoloris TaxID=254408 RepID=UPI000371B39B|nr:MFS transporter [Solimonas variicoloris]